MLNSGTWSAPILCSLVPPSKTILTPGASFKLKTTDINNTYELYCCTCSNGANMKKNNDFTNSFSPVGSIGFICLPLSLVAPPTTGSSMFLIHQIPSKLPLSLILMIEHTSLSPHFTLNGSKLNGLTTSSHQKTSKDLVFQCICAIQGTKDAGTDGMLYYARLY
jgi:hypothetical protein